ncbi:MAG: hypothetical protein FWC41_13485 [Firmicutes bacterium]|nr:hypothetical protein [Bacillota bacterium]
MNSIKSKIKGLDIESIENEINKQTPSFVDENDKFSKMKDKMQKEKTKSLNALASIRKDFVYKDIHHLTTHLIMEVITQIDVVREELSKIEIIYIDLVNKSEQSKAKLLSQAQSGERSNMETIKIKMNALMSDSNTQLALFEEHIKFYNDTLKQLDRISFAIKNKVDIYSKEN